MAADDAREEDHRVEGEPGVLLASFFSLWLTCTCRVLSSHCEPDHCHSQPTSARDSLLQGQYSLCNWNPESSAVSECVLLPPFGGTIAKTVQCVPTIDDCLIKCA